MHKRPGQKFWNTPQFKKLQTEWEEKLKESGFSDVEDENRRLKQRAQNSYRTEELVLIESKRRYYELLGHMAHQEVFRDDVERIIIEYRANGMMFKDIRKKLKAMGERCGRETVRRIIRYYESKWQIKKK